LSISRRSISFGTAGRDKGQVRTPPRFQELVHQHRDKSVLAVTLLLR
jgi:hypothetical protein